MALRQRAPAAPPHVAPEIAAFGDLLPYATPPLEVTCRQGCHSYVARQVALRDGHILFIDPRTDQFGIARLDPSGGIEARQYPSASIAFVMFLGPREAMDE
jgi:hypothetical protein